jgi:hypothetical protein
MKKASRASRDSPAASPSGWIPVFTGMTILMPSRSHADRRPDFQTIDPSTPDHWPTLSQIFASP